MAEPKCQSTRAQQRVNPSPVVDLRELAGRRYKTEYEPAYQAEHGRHARIDDPWLLMVPGKLGHIYPYGGDLLAVSSNARGPVANKLIALPYCQLAQDGDDGVTVIVHRQFFGEVAKIIRARGRRVLSAAERRNLVAAGAASRFQKRAVTVAPQTPSGAGCDDPAPTFLA